MLDVFNLLFFLLPLANATLDYISVNASRWAFKESYDAGSLRTFTLLCTDLLLAGVFKLVVLGLLLGSAHLFEGSGATFSVFQVEEYFGYIFPLHADFSPETFALKHTYQREGGFVYPHFAMISAMVVTTLLPTLVHFVWSGGYFLAQVTKWFVQLLRYLVVGSWLSYFIGYLVTIIIILVISYLSSLSW